MVLPLDHYSGSSMGNLPIGQGELVTPMQMASRLLGDRQRRHPAPAAHRQLGRRRSRARAGRAPRDLARRPPPRCARCSRACSRPGGTASEVSIPGYQLAGKTGTASKIDPATGEYSKTAYVASFMGFAPGVEPEAAVRGGRRRTADRLDLRRHGRGARVRADHELRAAVPGHPARDSISAMTARRS